MLASTPLAAALLHGLAAALLLSLLEQCRHLSLAAADQMSKIAVVTAAGLMPTKLHQPQPAVSQRQHLLPDSTALWPPASSPVPGMHSPLHQIQPQQRGLQSAGRGTQWRLHPAGGGCCPVALPHQQSPRFRHHPPPGSLQFGPPAAPHALLLRCLRQGSPHASGRSHPRLLPAASPLPARQVHFSAQQLQSSAGHVQRSAEQPFS